MKNKTKKINRITRITKIRKKNKKPGNIKTQKVRKNNRIGRECNATSRIFNRNKGGMFSAVRHTAQRAAATALPIATAASGLFRKTQKHLEEEAITSVIEPPLEESGDELMKRVYEATIQQTPLEQKPFKVPLATRLDSRLKIPVQLPKYALEYQKRGIDLATKAHREFTKQDADKIIRQHLAAEPEPEPKVKTIISKEPFSKISSQNEWFSAVKGLIVKIKKNRNIANYTIEALKEMDDYNDKLKTYNYDDEEMVKIKDSIDSKVRAVTNFMKKYNVEYDERSGYKYSMTEEDKVDVKKNRSLFYNLFTYTDFSLDQIKRAYCNEWTKHFCDEKDSIRNVVYKILISQIASYYSDPIKRAAMWSSSDIEFPEEPAKESKVRKTHEHWGPSLTVPLTGIPIRLDAAINVAVSAVTGEWGPEWLHETLGIIEPIIQETIEDIKNSEEYGIDPVALIIGNVFNKSDEEVKRIFDRYATINGIKNAINLFLIENADNLAREFNETHFVDFDKKVLSKMTNELLHDLKLGILYSAIHDSDYPDETLEQHMSRLENSMAHDSEYYYSSELGKFAQEFENKDPSRYESDKDTEDTLESIAKAKLGMIEELDGGKRKNK